MLEVKRPVSRAFPVSSPFGTRTINGQEQEHKGVDFATPEGTPVYSMVNGRIFRVGYEDPANPSKGLGLRVWQEFTDPKSELSFYCWYGHLSKVLVAEGETVVAGQPIGETGNTGRSTGPHLHVQFRKKNSKEMFDAVFI